MLVAASVVLVGKGRTVTGVVALVLILVITVE